MKPESELIHGIEEQTQNEIERIREELARLEADRKGRVERELESIRKKTDEYAASQIEKAKRASAAAVATECHKIELEARERFFKQVLRSAESRLRERIGDEGYPAVLKNWIVEAAVGLAASEAQVSTTETERELCRRVLDEAAAEASRLLGTNVRLELSEIPLKNGQGVVLTARSGRTAYNNQVRTRMMRRETAVRKVIYDELSRTRAQRPPDNEQRGESGEHDG